MSRRPRFPGRCLLNTTPTHESRQDRLIPAEQLSRSAVTEAECDDAAYDEDEKGSLRRCVVTRERFSPESMLRFVVTPDNILFPDVDARLPGRGIWLSARQDVLETALTRGAFARAARCQVVIPSDLADVIEAGLLRRMTQTLGLARRAGQAVSGFAKVREWIEAKAVGLVVQASDGSPEEAMRLLSGARHLPVARFLPAAILGRAFGRERVVHAALRTGALADRLRQDCERFAGLSKRAVLFAPGYSGDGVEQADR